MDQEELFADLCQAMSEEDLSSSYSEDSVSVTTPSAVAVLDNWVLRRLRIIGCTHKDIIRTVVHRFVEERITNPGLKAMSLAALEAAITALCG